MSKENIVIGHVFCCTRCGNKGIPIPRMKNCLREEGHLKNLYCLRCGKTVKEDFVEVAVGS